MLRSPYKLRRVWAPRKVVREVDWATAEAVERLLSKDGSTLLLPRASDTVAKALGQDMDRPALVRSRTAA
jgi:hypothetical protein